jgi:uncharacterized membrane protein YtjA (UPF0391 family)
MASLTSLRRLTSTFGGTSPACNHYIRGPTVEVAVLKWALIFFVVSIIAGVFGFTGISAATAGIARILFGLFLVIFIVLLVFALLAGETLF